MELPSREAFAARYRTLTPGERRAFLADLWTARGWETTVEEGVVVAIRDGNTRRIAVDTPDERAVDALVAVDESLRSIADERGLDVFEPETLRDESLYGLDRDRASELFGTHFGETDWASLEAETGEAPGPKRDRTAEAVSSVSGVETTGSAGPVSGTAETELTDIASGGYNARSTDTVSESDGDGGDDLASEGRDLRSLAFVLVSGLVVALFLVSSSYGLLALPDAVSLGDDDLSQGTDPIDSGTTTEAPEESETGTTDDSTTGSDGDTDEAESSTASQIPPRSLSLNDSLGGDEVASAHADSVAEHSSFGFRVRSEGPTHADGIEPPGDLDVRVAAQNRFLIEDRSDRHADGNLSVDLFADGGREYRRFSAPDGVRYNRYAISSNPTVTEWSGQYGADLIGTYLNSSELTVQRRPGDEGTSYLITATEPPAGLAEEAAEYRASAALSPDGTVRELTVTYRHEPTGERVWIALRYDMSETEVETPLWYDRALERLGPASGE